MPWRREQPVQLKEPNRSMARLQKVSRQGWAAQGKGTAGQRAQSGAAGDVHLRTGLGGRLGSLGTAAGRQAEVR